MFKKCSLEEVLSERHFVSYFFEEISNVLIWRIDLDGVTWFELLSTGNSTTITMSGKTFVLRGNSLVLEALDMAKSPRTYSEHDINESFCLDLQYPTLNGSTIMVKNKIIEVIILIASKLALAGSNSVTTGQDNGLETPERQLIKQIIQSSDRHYAHYVPIHGRNRNFEESLITAKQRLNIR